MNISKMEQFTLLDCIQNQLLTLRHSRCIFPSTTFLSVQESRQAPDLLRRIVMRIMLPFNRPVICHRITHQVNMWCFIQHWIRKIQMLQICGAGGGL